MYVWKMEFSDFESERDRAVSMTSDFGQPSIAESTIPESSYDASTSAEFFNVCVKIFFKNRLKVEE